ncbi:MAG: MaoC family dehydratase [Gammaproteobacteria bacterium]|jgi:acyl dehydratase|nr:MaoC family dehydratase [Gammaproteobacteria bacterium]
MSLEQSRAQLQALVGRESHASDWLEVTQRRVDDFAAATGDHQWIHVDPARARAESPYGSTIAHGYLTLSLYPLLRGLVDEARPVMPGVLRVINYGINKLRFPNAVRVGARVRGRSTVAAVEDIPGGLQLTEQFTVEVEGENKPACVAEVVMRLYF